jgi:hypothetical protein
MEEAIRVGPARGFVRFVPVPEECSGWKGNTIAGAREREKDKGRERERERTGAADRDGEDSPAQRRRAMRVCPLSDFMFERY